MATKTISWGDGSGDNITLTYDAMSGNQTVSVSSARNLTSQKRTKTITFKTESGTVSRTLSLSQAYATEQTKPLNPSAFLSGQYASISGQTNPVGKSETSTSYATVNLKTGSRATSWAYWKFDTSSIPEDAVITSVTCKAKVYISTTTSSRVGTRQVQLFSGETAKGSASTVSTSTTALTLSCGTWTRDELDDLRIRVYGVRGTSNTTTTYYFRFYGATVTIKYK